MLPAPFSAGSGVYVLYYQHPSLTGTFIITSVTVTTITLTNNNTLTVVRRFQGRVD